MKGDRGERGGAVWGRKYTVGGHVEGERRGTIWTGIRQDKQRGQRDREVGLGKERKLGDRTGLWAERFGGQRGGVESRWGQRQRMG